MAAVSLQPVTSLAHDAMEQTPAPPSGQTVAANALAVATPNDTVNVSSLAVAAT